MVSFVIKKCKRKEDRKRKMTKISTICVYCGSSDDVSDLFKQESENLGKMIGENGYDLVYGGASIGLMGRVANAVMQAGGKTIGVIPTHILDHEAKHTGLTELHIVDTMHERKQMMAERADVFVAFPGGMGTLDETFEILTWKYLGLHKKPIIFVNLDGYWDPVLKMIHDMVDQGLARTWHLDIFKTVDTVEELAALVVELEADDAPTSLEQA